MVPVPVVIMVFVPILLHLMTIFVVAVAISVSIADLGGAAIIPVMIVSPAVVSVMVVSTPVIGIMIVSDDAIAEARVVPEARIVSETRLILASPFPIFPLALAFQPVVFNIVIVALSQPFPVIRIVVSVVAAGSAICVWVVLIPMLRASGGQNRSCSQS